MLAESQPPDWVKDYPLPKQIPIESAITEIDRQIEESSQRLIQLKEELLTETRFSSLLYETGEDALEPIVRDALAYLGAKVDDPRVKGKDDGRLTSPNGKEGTLEIKGRTGSLKRSDVRELDDWVRGSLIIEGRRSKGILIANLGRELPPSERKDILPPDAVQAAKETNICVLKTSQLYKAIQQRQRGEFNKDEFWEKIFSTDGVSDLPDLE